MTLQDPSCCIVETLEEVGHDEVESILKSLYPSLEIVHDGGSDNEYACLCVFSGAHFCKVKTPDGIQDRLISAGSSNSDDVTFNGVVFLSSCLDERMILVLV
mmetsp:Transcript_58964/g.70963  ORF Transcript_58964/g.70963 Transcript_58964/m.70963 type:complete len:102 (-) Transcript_58964:153-458(-)